MNEKLIERKLKTGVEKLGGLALKLVCLSFTGIPDRTVLMPGGKVWFAELKTTGKKPSPRQVIVIAFLRKLGFSVYVIDTERQLDDFLKNIQK